MWVCRLPVHIGPAVCTVFMKISGEFAAAQGADRVVGPYMTPANSCCPANFECKAFLPQSFKGSCYQIWCIVTGGAYQSAREVTWCVRNDYKTGSCLNCTRRTHQTRPSAPFLPHLFRQGGKDGAAGGASETASTERAPALCAKPLILCVRFLLSKPQTLCWFAAWVWPRRIHKTAPFRSNGAVHAYMGGGSYSAEMR